MSSASRVLGIIAPVLVCVFAGAVLAFALGYAFDDPGGGAAVLITVGEVVPVVGLSLLAAHRPTVAQ